MPSRLAILMGRHTVRVLAADALHGGRYRWIEQAQFASDEAHDAAADPDDMSGGWVGGLTALVQERKWTSTSTIVLLDRSEVELRNLSLPPVPEEELPDMVRIQAVRNFAAAGDRAIIDYIPIERRDDGVEVIAAATDAKTIGKLSQSIVSTGLTLHRVTIRSVAVAALYDAVVSHHGGESVTDATMVCVADGGADLVVIADGRRRAIRSVRVPDDAPAAAKAIIAEVKRSRAASDCSGDSSLLWIGDADDELAQALEAAGSTVVAVDPLDWGQAGSNWQTTSADASAIAPLVAAIDADSRGGTSLVDFLSPRRRPEIKPNRFKQVLMVAAPILALLAIGIAVTMVLRKLDAQIAAVDQEIASMGDAVADADLTVAETEKVDRFLDGDVIWLDEIERVAKLAPASDELIVTELRGNADVANGGGALNVKGRVVAPAVLDRLAAEVRDDNHQIIGEGAKAIKTEDAYRWDFTQRVLIDGAAVHEDRYRKMNETPDEPTNDGDQA